MYAFAPLLSKDLDMDNLRIALFNFICAKQEKKPFTLRIDDTNGQKDMDEKIQNIVMLLGLFGLESKEIFYQSANLKFHRQFASKLLQTNDAFSCFCDEKNLKNRQDNAQKKGKLYHYSGDCKKLSDDEVLNNENPFTIRIKRPKKSINLIDTIKGKLEFKPKEIDDFIIMTKEKYPTYDFACGIDDMIYNVTHIIRSDERIQNSLRQLHVKNLLGFNEKITYTHLPKILWDDEALSVAWLLENGFLPEAIINYLILLSYKTPQEIFTLKDAITWFDLKAVSKSLVKFDMEKLKEINKKHK